MNKLGRHISRCIPAVVVIAILLGSFGVPMSACPHMAAMAMSKEKVVSSHSCCVKKKGDAGRQRKSCCGNERDRCFCLMSLVLYLDHRPELRAADRSSVPAAMLEEMALALPLDPPFHPPRG